VTGTGVLFTVTLPAASRDPRPDGTRPEPKPDTEWERTRNQLRGEKITPPDSAEKKEPSVGERVLAVLAKNGHNFSQLPADESITVVLVFRPDARGNWPATGAQPSTLKGFVFNERNVDLAGAGQTARDQQLLGDLHMKNGRVDEAIQAYSKALSVLGDDLNKPLTALQQHAEALEELYDKLVQATAKSGKADVTRKLVERLSEWKKAKQSGPKPGALPARLTLSAPKKLLDQVGKDKLTFEEFKKAATVEYQTFPAGAK
jgi:tetratricopeptide (TPR) repeat protein